MTCTATVTVVGIGTVTCEDPDGIADHGRFHIAALPVDSGWAGVSWTSDTAVIALPVSPVEWGRVDV